MEALWLEINGETFALRGTSDDGTQPSAPWRDATRADPDDSVDGVEIFTLRLEGNRADVLDGLDALEALAQQVNAPDVPGESACRLWMRPAAREIAWSRVLTALRLSLRIDARSPYRARVRLRATLRGAWQGAPIALALSNAAHPSPTFDALPLALRDDPPNVCNWVEFDAPSACGSAVLRVEVTNQGQYPLGQIWLGLWRGGTAPDTRRIEAEADETANFEAIPTASGGWGARITAPTAGLQPLLHLPLPAGLLAANEGRALRVLLRLAAPGEESHVVLRAHLADAAGEMVALGRVVWPGELGGTSAALGLRDLGTLLPRRRVGEGGQLVISAQAVDGAPATLLVDYAELAPADAFRRLSAPGGVGLLPAERLVDDASTALLTSYAPAPSDDAGALWLGTGGALRVEPGRRQRLYLYAQGSAAHQAYFAHAPAVRLSAIPLREWLD